MAQFTRNSLDTSKKIKQEILRLKYSLPDRPLSAEIEAARSFLMQQGAGIPDISSCKIDQNIKSPEVPQEVYDLFEECLIKHTCYRTEYLKFKAMKKIALESFYEVAEKALSDLELDAGTTELAEPPVKQVAQTSSHALDAGSSTKHIAEPRVQEVALNPLGATSTETAEPPVQKVAQSTKIVRLEPVEDSADEKWSSESLHHAFRLWAAEFRTSINLNNLISDNVERLPRNFYLVRSYLEELDISNNKLVELPSFRAFTRLNRLNVENNDIQSIPPTISYCIYLRVLRAGQNMLQALPEMKFSDMEILSVPDNFIPMFPESVKYMTNLREIDVSSNQITSIPKWLCSIVSIVKIDISHNRLISLPKKIGKLIMLEELRMGGNHIEYLPASFRKLKKLHILHADASVLKEPPPAIVEKGAEEVVKYMKNTYWKPVPATARLVRKINRQ